MNDLFAAHPRTWREFRYCYPVISRRSHGLSLGINLNPDGVCNFACAYCSVDRPALAAQLAAGAVQLVDEAALGRELQALLTLAASGAIWNEAPFDRTPAHLRRINDLAFSGDGEPTSYPGFPRLLAMAGWELDRLQLPEVKIVVISNATLFQKASVREALVALAARPSEVWAKLDAGTEAWYRAIDRSEVPFQRILDNLRDLGRLRPLVIQSLFCRLHGQAPSAAELDAWRDRLRELVAAGARIELVQVYTTARVTAEKWATALSGIELEGIAARLRGLPFRTEIHT